MDDQLLAMRHEAAIALAKRSMMTVPRAEALMLECGDNFQMASACVAISEAFRLCPFNVASTIKALAR